VVLASIASLVFTSFFQLMQRQGCDAFYAKGPKIRTTRRFVVAYVVWRWGGFEGRRRRRPANWARGCCDTTRPKHATQHGGSIFVATFTVSLADNLKFRQGLAAQRRFGVAFSFSFFVWGPRIAHSKTFCLMLRLFADESSNSGSIGGAIPTDQATATAGDR